MEYNPDDDPEGATPLDPDELEGLKFKHITTRGELDELEQSNFSPVYCGLSAAGVKTFWTASFYGNFINSYSAMFGRGQGHLEPARKISVSTLL